MIISFFDDEKISDLYPLTLTRPAADLRCGLFTIAEKWQHDLSASAIGYETRDYLKGKFPEVSDASLIINGKVLPDEALVAKVLALQPGESLVKGDILIAEMKGENRVAIQYENEPDIIHRPFQIFLSLQKQIALDFHRKTSGRKSAIISNTNVIIGDHPVFVEEGSYLECVTIHAKNGPVYIGENCELMEGTMIRGPFAMAANSVTKLGTKIYGPTALGPFSVIGGEVNNIQFQGYANKGHDGFIGNAVIGEWCNLGADTNCSNLKNTYEEVKVWNYSSGRFDKSGQQFCGLIMGDHSKCGINTMFNTGTVVGVAANIFGSGFPRQFVPDFAWGGASGFTTYKLDAAFKTASLVMPRRKKEFDETEQNIIREVFEMTRDFRNWE